MYFLAPGSSRLVRRIHPPSGLQVPPLPTQGPQYVVGLGPARYMMLNMRRQGLQLDFVAHRQRPTKYGRIGAPFRNLSYTSNVNCEESPKRLRISRIW